MAGSDYSDPLYLERPVDEALLEAARKWLGSNLPVHWVSLRTSPGQGNTWLLKRLQDVASKLIGFEDIQKLFVSSDDADVKHRLGPLGLALFRRSRSKKLTLFQPLKRRLRRMSRGHLVIITTIVVVCFVIACFVKGIDEFLSTAELSWGDPSIWWSTFWNGFFPHHWYTFPLLLVTDRILDLIATVTVSLFGAHLYRSKKKHKEQVKLEEPSEEELEYYTSAEGMADELFEICHKFRGIMLLIDEPHRLPDVEKQLLIDLSNENSTTVAQGFTQRYKVLIVTVESRNGSASTFPPESNVQALQVGPFSLTELREIALAQLTGEEDQRVRDLINKTSEQSAPPDEKDPKSEDLLEQAQSNIKVLFAHRERHLMDQMGQEFETAKKDGIKGIFGLGELLAYVALLHEGLIGKSKLFETLKAAESNHHLGLFGLMPPNDLEGLVNKFVASSLVKFIAKDINDPDEQMCYLDLVRCQAMRRWLREQKERQSLVVHAHYYWFSMLSHSLVPSDVKPEHVHEISRTHSDLIRRAAWHAVQIGKYIDELSDLLAHAKITEDERTHRCSQVAAVLISAAVVYREEGDLIEANDLLFDAEEWLCKSSAPEHRKWLECAADHLWHNFWLRNTATTRAQLARFAEAFPDLSKAPFWRVHERFEEILQGKEKLSDPPDEALLSNNDQTNLHRLTEMLKDIRDTNGLIEPALRDETVSIREPQKSRISPFAESHLRQLQVAAMNARGLEPELKDAIDEWRRRLRETEPSSANLGSEVLHTYDEARYWHLLADVHRRGTEQLENSSDKNAQADLDAQILTAARIKESSELRSAEHLWYHAQTAYERVLQIAALLDWQSLVMEVSFHLGVLLQQYTPEQQRNKNTPWWEPWDKLFKKSIDLERELGWVIHTPAMHRIRWQFFEDIDREHNLDNAYNAFQSAKRAHFPIELILKWHEQVSRLFTNYSDSDLDRQREAELHEEWANKLAALDAASDYRTFEHLELEQAHALMFAAQARRLLNEAEHAEKVLDRADDLYDQAVVKLSKEELEDKKLRSLKNSLKMQRAWVYKALKRKQEYSQAIRDMWRTMKPDDDACSNLLDSLFFIEHEEKILDNPWPQTPDLAPNLDPDNDALSLPAEWFDDDRQLQLNNRFEFRICQFLNLTNVNKAFAGDGDDSEFASMASLLRVVQRRGMMSSSPARYIFQSHPNLQFSVEVLKIAATMNWMGMNRYGEIGISLCKLGLYYKHSPAIRVFIINLLEAIRFYFATVNPVDSDELHTLNLLMNYDVDCRLDYVRVLTNSKYMLEQELRARQAGEGPNWFGIAKRINDYLGVLVDTALLSNAMVGGMQLTRLSAEDFQKRLEHLRKTVTEAQGLFDRGYAGQCLQMLQHVLPAKTGQWVFLEELQLLDLWLRCARAGNGTKNADQLRLRATQLRESALKYIGQFRLVIKEQQVQKLTMELLKSIEQSID